MAAAPSDVEAPRRTRSRWTRWVVLAVVALVVAWTAVAGYRLVEARRHAQAGLDELRAAQDQLDPAELIRGAGLADMRSAKAEFDRAEAAADSLFVAPFRVLPFVGRQVRSVQALSSGAARVVHVGVDAMEASSRELDTTARSGPERVALVERLRGIGARASAGLRDIGLGPGDALIGPLQTARDRFARELRKARRAMRDVELASRGIARMARGPSHYLLLAANQAEMRAGSGMLLSVGVLTVENGRFDLGPMQSVGELALPPGAVPVTGDYGDRWGWLQPTEEWRYLAMSPQFDTTGSLAAQMWKARTGQDVDGVLALDATALRALVKVSGPVDVGGTRIDESNVVKEILLRQYLDVPADAAASESSVNEQRRDRNGEIARAIVDRLDEVGWDLASMVDDLRGAARGRHVLFWSSDAIEQRAWKAAGVSGMLPSDGFMVSLENRAGNKLDQFQAVSVRLDHRKVADGTEIAARVTVANETPADGLNRYVEGPYRVGDFVAGEYRGILAVSIPERSRDIHLDGVERLVAAGPDGTTRVVAGDIRLLRGETKSFTVRFVVPSPSEGLEIVPSARHPAIDYRAGGDQWEDDGPHRYRW